MGVARAGASIREMWRDLSPAQRRWIYVNALLVTAVINLLVNAGIAWLSSAGEHRVPLWSVPLVEKPSTVIDTVGTFFLLPLITCLLMTTAVRYEIGSGRLLPLESSGAARALLDRLPRTRFRRGAVLGALCVVALGPVAILVLSAIDFSGITTGQFVLYKAALGVVLGALVTPVIAMLAMADGVVEREPAVSTPQTAA
jgi:hypothetical protein